VVDSPAAAITENVAGIRQPSRLNGFVPQCCKGNHPPAVLRHESETPTPIMTDFRGKVRRSMFGQRVCALRIPLEGQLYRDAIIKAWRKICSLKIG